MREMKRKVGNGGARLRLSGVDWSVVTCLFADDTLLLVKSVRELQRAVDKSYSLAEKEAKSEC